MPSALEAQSLNRWTPREVPLTLIFTAGVEVFSWGWGRRERGWRVDLRQVRWRTTGRATRNTDTWLLHTAASVFRLFMNSAIIAACGEVPGAVPAAGDPGPTKTSSLTSWSSRPGVRNGQRMGDCVMEFQGVTGQTRT